MPVLGGCGGVEQPPSQTVASGSQAQTAPTTPTATTPTAPTATTPEPPASSGNPDAPAPTTTSTTPTGGAPLHFDGDGTKKLGALHVPKDSVLKWTNDGRTFAVTDSAFKIKIQSTEHSGSAPVQAGDYAGVEVDASGKWTIDITPR
jgi:hypothetical protein